MRIKPTTITITEEPYSGHIHIRVVVHHQNGESHCAALITEHTLGEKIETVSNKILEILKEYKNDGTLEE